MAGESTQNLSEVLKAEDEVAPSTSMGLFFMGLLFCHASFRMNKAKKDHNKALVNAQKLAPLTGGTCKILHSMPL